MSNELWNKWSDVHNSPDQQKRIASAKKSACTPVSVDQSARTGTFKGSSGTHTTSLDHCSCVDFNRRKLPCKHMYRLAMELGAFQTDFDSDKSAIVEPKSSIHRERLSATIKVVETLTEAQQRLLLEAIRSITSNHPTECLESTPDLSALIDANLIEPVVDAAQCLAKYKKNDLLILANSLGLEPDKKLLKADLINYLVENASQQLETQPLAYTVVRPCEHIRRRQVHMYLHRKFEGTGNYSVSIGINHVSDLQEVFPDDAVTDLLIQYGYYTPPED